MATEEAVNIKQSTSDPISIDTGNQKIQGRIVSKTVQFGLFTNNPNAMWACKNQLRKESYPFATFNLKVNRNAFPLEIGDTFKFSYSKYNIVDMVLRILQRGEAELESEDITIIAIEDLFQITNTISDYYSPPQGYGKVRTGYTVEPIIHEKLFETVYALSKGDVAVTPLAARESQNDLGFDAYISIDGNASYSPNPIARGLFFRAYGTLVGTYPEETYEIDESIGMTIDFSNDDVALIESQTWPTVLSGSQNLALLGDEIISFKTITPVTATQYLLEGIIRGRYGTEKVAHSNGEMFFFLGQDIPVVKNDNISSGADRFFKLVGFNSVEFGDIAEAVAVEHLFSGVAKTPYVPINFKANGGSFAARYDIDVILTWSARYRSKGAGIGIPGTVLFDLDYEGLFEIEVWVGGIKILTQSAIDALTWTYASTEDEILFKLSNYRTEDGITYKSGQAQVICKKN
jgi:hypothetical protein